MLYDKTLSMKSVKDCPHFLHCLPFKPRDWGPSAIWPSPPCPQGASSACLPYFCKTLLLTYNLCLWPEPKNFSTRVFLDLPLVTKPSKASTKNTVNLKMSNQ
jgi:hypothetical protein